MKYCVHGFYQPRAVELGLTNDDLLVLRWFVDFVGTKKMRTIIKDDKVYYWVNYDVILSDLPVLNIKKRTLFSGRFGNLCRAEVLVRHQEKGGGTYSYYCYGLNYDTLQYLQEPSDEDKCKNLHTSAKKCTSEMQKNALDKCEKTHLIYPNTNNPNINKSIKKVSKPQDGDISFDTIISNYTLNEELKAALVEFIKMRKLIKKPLTNRALELILAKLKNLATTEADSIAIINQSICNSWQGIFPLKTNTQSQSSRQQFQKAAVNYDEE